MNRIKVLITIGCVSIIVLGFPPNVKADSWDHKTVLKFSETIEIPGVGQQFLPAGTYVFKLMGSADRHIVQISNEAENHVFATVLAIPNYRHTPTGKTVITFGERAAGKPQAIRAWFYPGSSWGEEFVYPKQRAVELAKLTNLPVLAMPANLATNIGLPVKTGTEAPVVALMKAPLKAIKPTGEEVELAEVVELPPAQARPEARTSREPAARLPQTASSLPLLGLLGLLSLGAGTALWLIPKRAA